MLPLECLFGGLIWLTGLVTGWGQLNTSHFILECLIVRHQFWKVHLLKWSQIKMFVIHVSTTMKGVFVSPKFWLLNSLESLIFNALKSNDTIAYVRAYFNLFVNPGLQHTLKLDVKVLLLTEKLKKISLEHRST